MPPLSGCGTAVASMATAMPTMLHSRQTHAASAAPSSSEGVPALSRQRWMRAVVL
jgi:hypothetical protein